MFIYPRMYRKMKRGPQVILPKDIGIIIAYSGIGKDSTCIDSGTGSGWLACSLARIAKKVYSYEIREDFAKIAEKNKFLLGLDNLEIKVADVTKGVKEKDVDLFVIDMPNAEKALKVAKKALLPDATVVGYMPNMEQVSKFSKKAESLGFYDTHCIEVIVRDMLVRPEGMRPSTKGIWHTAYLFFARNSSAQKG